MSTKLPNGEGVIVESYDALSFSKDAIALFGREIPELQDEPELLHMQIGILGDAVRGAENGDFVTKLCGFIDEALSNAKAVSEIENAVAISFLSAAEFRKPIAGAVRWDYIPEQIKKILIAQEQIDNAT